MNPIFAAAAGVLLGGGGGYILFFLLLKGKSQKIIRDAKQRGENIKEKKILQAKEKFISLKEKHATERKELDRKLNEREERIKRTESNLQRTIDQNKKEGRQNKNKQEKLDQGLTDLEKRETELKNDHQKVLEALEGLSGMTADEAKSEILEQIKSEAKFLAASQAQKIIDEAKENASEQAKKIVIQTIQRVATEHSIENSTSTVQLKNEDVKGRIIGREGRNIRALEAATGVEFIVDDTPEAIILSCFDPVRREVARLALNQLMADGRIHPGRIEEVVAKMSKKIEEEIAQHGKRTVLDLGLHNMNNKLVRMVGRMKFRSSYGQNLLQHSREVANLCAAMASEFGLDAKAAKRAGLLHDIGKVSEEESELPHAILGMKIAKSAGENDDVCNAIGAHHDEIEMTSLLSPIIQVCDGISGARPGARREMVEAYIQRLKDLESIAMRYTGVKKAFAIQAGRELRVIVDSGQVSDVESDHLSFDISQRIMNDMTYPGQVKVIVIRERRAVSIAR